ncbi:MAG: hypothetical protein KJO98_04795 [Rhodothermia bacterium]|nr:hypothetical protein [Rhodothermia bacterium]
MAKDAQTVYNEIVAHIDKQGGPASAWYCGITEDPERRVFDEHGVPRQKHWRIWRECYSDTDARAVENTLIEYGCDGGGGGGDQDTIFVYAYLKKRGITNP